MTRPTTRRLAIPCLCVLALPAIAHAGILAPAKPSQVLTVNASGLTSCSTAGLPAMRFDQVVPGDLSSFPPFMIPVGQVFVITGLDWRVIGTPAGEATGATLRLEGNSTIATVFADTDTANPNGASGRAVAVPNVIVESGIAICVVVGGNGSGLSAVLHGFLTTDK